MTYSKYVKVRASLSLIKKCALYLKCFQQQPIIIFSESTYNHPPLTQEHLQPPYHSTSFILKAENFLF